MMVLVAITLNIKARDDQVAAISQKQTTESLALAEGGMSRTLGFLNHNYNFLLKFNYDPKGLLGTDAPDEWSSLTFPPCITNLNDILVGKIPTSAPVNTYTVEAYRYDAANETGTLIVKGYPPNSTAVSRIQQTMNISPKTSPASFPGLMAQDITLGNNDVLGAISGNVLCTNSTNCAVPKDQCVNGQPTQNGLRAAIGAKPNGEVEGEIYIGEVVWPILPKMPSDAIPVTIDGVTLSNVPVTIDSVAKTKKKGKANKKGRADKKGKANKKGRTDKKGRADKKGSSNSEFQFPRRGDTPSADGAYHYDVSAIELKGNDDPIEIDTTDAPVYFYVSGDITMSGNATIKHICTGTANSCGAYGTDSDGTSLGSPHRFHIYGKADDGDATYDQEFTLNGGATPTNVFIHAPDARMGINGGRSNPDIRGAVWVREWNGSNSNNAEIVVPNAMQSLLSGLKIDLTSAYSRTSSATSWTRIEDN